MIGIRTSVSAPYLTRSVDGGQTWVAVDDLPVANIQVMVTATGIHTANTHQLWVYGEADSTLTPFMITSLDGGVTWQEQTMANLSGNSIYHMSAVSFGASNDSVQAFAVTIESSTFASGGQILNYRQPLGFVSAVQERHTSLPQDYLLAQNHPNPFNPQTTITFALPERGAVTLKIYSMLGEEVQRLFLNQEMPAGLHQVVWDARSHTSGVYFYRLTAKNFSQIKKMVLLQ